MNPAPQGTQVEVADVFLASVPPFRCAQCRHVRFACWRDSALCDHCVPPPSGGFRCYFRDEAPRQAVENYTPHTPSPSSLPPALQLHGDIAFAGAIVFGSIAARNWG